MKNLFGLIGRDLHLGRISLEQFNIGQNAFIFKTTFMMCLRGHGGRVVTHSPPTSKIRVRIRPDLEWGSWYLLAVCLQFTVQNLDQLYVLVSSAHPSTHCDIILILILIQLL